MHRRHMVDEYKTAIEHLRCGQVGIFTCKTILQTVDFYAVLLEEFRMSCFVPQGHLLFLM